MACRVPIEVFNEGLKDVVAAALTALKIDYSSGVVPLRKAVLYFCGVCNLYVALWGGVCGVVDVGELRRGGGSFIDGVVVAYAVLEVLKPYDALEVWTVVRHLMKGVFYRVGGGQALYERLRVYRVTPHQVAKWFSEPRGQAIRIRFFNTDTEDVADVLESSFLGELRELAKRVERYSVLVWRRRRASPTEVGRSLYHLARRVMERCKGFERRVYQRLDAFLKRVPG